MRSRHYFRGIIFVFLIGISLLYRVPTAYGLSLSGAPLFIPDGTHHVWFDTQDAGTAANFFGTITVAGGVLTSLYVVMANSIFDWNYDANNDNVTQNTATLFTIQDTTLPSLNIVSPPANLTLQPTFIPTWKGQWNAAPTGLVACTSGCTWGVPEPASVSLFLFGLGGVGLWRVVRRK